MILNTKALSQLDGRRFWVRITGEAVLDVDGNICGLQGFMQDVTESRLLQERLAQSQRLKALGQLTGGVAHDFNNLLTVIMVNGMESLLRHTLMENFEIEFVHAGGLWTALIDPARFESAVLNLCLNARDAMPDGGRLTIETCNAALDQDYTDRHDEVQPGQYVMVGVTDSGTGMSQETLAHVFDPFFTTKGRDQGTGLGLSMVYGFVKQSKGHIKIYSEAGHGTTVRLYLPKAVETKVQDKATSTPLLRGHNEMILLVEDDEMVRVYVHHLLEDLGYQVLSASNGPEAMELLDKIRHYPLISGS